MRSVLVISKQEEAFRTLRECFHKESRVQKAASRAAAMNKLRRRRYDFIFIDLELLSPPSGTDGYKAALEPFRRLYPTVEIIVMSPQEMIREAVMAVKAGASNYLTFPINREEARHILEMAHESMIMQSELDHLREQTWQNAPLEFIQTESPFMKRILGKIRSVAPTRSTVLLIGETGTGKGVLAKLIHLNSNRRHGPFISIHCGSIPEQLLESELFGHEKGAFTGAHRRKLGRFEIAKGGTIFLDEIGTISHSAQVKLLQILQDMTFQRIGGETTLKADVRVIAATNSDLKKMCDDGLFRKDLYYRLNVFPIEVPPLRERLEDIPHLVKVCLERLNRFHQKGIHKLHPRVMEAFYRYDWPGNIRELENLLERAYILESSPLLTPESFPAELFETTTLPENMVFEPNLPLAEVRRKGVEKIEISYLREQLSLNRGSIKDTAKAAGITTRQLHKLMKKYGLRKEHFKQGGNAVESMRSLH